MLLEVEGLQLGVVGRVLEGFRDYNPLGGVALEYWVLRDDFLALDVRVVEVAQVEYLELWKLRDADQDQLPDEGIACELQLEEVWAAFDEGLHAALDRAIGQVEHLQSK